jgi:hypothetical protein
MIAFNPGWDVPENQNIVQNFQEARIQRSFLCSFFGIFCSFPSSGRKNINVFLWEKTLAFILASWKGDQLSRL